MNPDLVIIRLGELMLKRKNRHRFLRSVRDRLQAVLKPFPGLQLEEEYGRIYIQLNNEPYTQVANELKKVFGIVSFSPAYRSPLDLQRIQDTARQMMQPLLAESSQVTFKVSANRANKEFPYDSQQLGYLVGGFLLQAFDQLKVDVHQPQYEVRLDIRREYALIFTEVEQGGGGYPKGSNGKAMLMLSGGIDSPVAGWYALRKGLELEAVHFHSYPYTSERAQQKVIDLTKILSVYSGSMNLHMVTFTEIQTRLLKGADEQLLITLMRRAMLRICSKLAVKRKASGIVTGESLGQVASQTLASMDVIGRATDMPLLRPLITMDKQEIIRQAETIGTYETSIQPYEDCCTLFVPKSPSINPDLSRVEKVEQSLEWLDEEIERAVSSAQLIELSDRDESKFEEYF
ncbi:tRNA uracil 4-sulfurtransferase ThiI [Paenibacillus senegalensis]|uniref:tRNA uracil 4-sulfurtransferase ThiI n=1 Tax=Paenibacillus senegalensis TaxID=1465766 RepID=UPI000288E6F0|nr:tRNA uracil 4-sulfurtransferase ThiI [Paenibacillus senegalensis]